MRAAFTRKQKQLLISAPPSFFSLPGLTQVEAERTEVLRLGAELNDLREAAEQDATAADEREAALKALLASETEVRSCAAAVLR